MKEYLNPHQLHPTDPGSWIENPLSAMMERRDVVVVVAAVVAADTLGMNPDTLVSSTSEIEPT